jgi:uncharacterized membrane protein YcaP (DUF421 family)
MEEIKQFFMAQGSDLGPGLVCLRTIVVFAVAIMYVRWAKKRFIAQATAMDLVLAVMFGSILSRSINGGANLVSGLVAGLTIIVLHRIALHWSYFSERFAQLVKGNAAVLVRDGVIDVAAMREHDVTEEDLKQEMRIRAMTEDVSGIKLAVLERSGQIGFIKK